MSNDVIARRSLGDDVAAKLRERIADGTFKISDKLPTEPELMKMFGVGRSSIREAVKLLVNVGMLRVQQGSGTFVQEPTAIQEPFAQRLKRSNYKDLDEVRQLLEIKIAEKAAINRTPADLVRIHSFLQQRNAAADAGDLQGCIAADVSFHIAIAEASKNEILADLYKSVAVQLQNWFSQVFTDATEFRKTAQMHIDIYNSIVAGDPKQAWIAASAPLGRFL